MKTLEMTDKNIPEGYLELIRFGLNEEGYLYSVYNREIPKEIILKSLKEWIKNEEVIKNDDN